MMSDDQHSLSCTGKREGGDESCPREAGLTQVGSDVCVAHDTLVVRQKCELEVRDGFDVTEAPAYSCARG
jgi:hypothetical protein